MIHSNMKWVGTLDHSYLVPDSRFTAFSLPTDQELTHHHGKNHLFSEMQVSFLRLQWNDLALLESFQVALWITWLMSYLEQCRIPARRKRSLCWVVCWDSNGIHSMAEAWGDFSQQAAACLVWLHISITKPIPIHFEYTEVLLMINGKYHF